MQSIYYNILKKYTIVIITNGISAVQKKRLENSKIKGYIDGMVVSEELKISKPNPEIFKYALKSLIVMINLLP